MERRTFWVRMLFASLMFVLGCFIFRLYLPEIVPFPLRHRQRVGPIGIIFHHSATPRRVGKVRIDARRIDVMHQKKGYRIEYEGKVYHIGYHYVILPDGTIQQGRPELCRGAHAHSVVRDKQRIEYNDKYLGICLIGNFSWKKSRRLGPSVAPTRSQVEATICLIEKLIDKYNIPLENVLRHRDVNQTYCPGSRFPYGFIMGRLKAYVASRNHRSPPIAQLGDHTAGGG